eukprot:TRINITY_DN17800_c0_g1_i1.p1 TRINITY_DN17800_c0_g1~~TRINITY_DN17800_c0_g1_i1.p1  ORF type:complete len:372 (+),score=62.17 TRINITY_DN17800_c0_g1_i1:57-1118(+)
MEGAMQVFIRLPDGEMRSVEMDIDGTGRDLYDAVRSVGGVAEGVRYCVAYEGAEVELETALGAQGLGADCVVDVAVNSAPPNYAELKTKRLQADEGAPLCLSKYTDHVLIHSFQYLSVLNIETGRTAQTIAVEDFSMSTIMCTAVTLDGDVILACKSPANPYLNLIVLAPRTDGVWSPTGRLVLTIPTENEVSFMGAGCRSVALHCKEHDIYIAEWNAVDTMRVVHQMSVTDKDYRGIGVSHDDKLIAVVNNTDSCVSVFSRTGLLLRTIGQGMLSFPQDVCFDTSGNVLVGGSSIIERVGSSSSSRSIGVFSSKGALLHCIPVGAWVWALNISGSTLAANTDVISAPVIIYS